MSEDKTDALSVLFILLHPSDSTTILRLLDLYKKDLISNDFWELLANFAKRYRAYGVVYPYAETIRQEILEELRKNSYSADALYCLRAWDDDPVRKQLIHIVSRSKNKLTKEELRLCVSAIAQNDYRGLLFKLIKLYDDVDLYLKKQLLIYFAHLQDPRIRPYLEKWRHSDYRDIRAFTNWAIFRLDMAEAAKAGQKKDRSFSDRSSK